MNCPHCFANVDDTASFCPACGTPLKTAAAAGSAGGTEPAAAQPGSAQSPADPGTAKASVGAASRRARVADEPERELWEASYSPKAMYGVWAAVTLLTLASFAVASLQLREWQHWGILILGLLVLWLLPLALLLYRRLSIHYRLTTQRFFHERGILKRVTDRIEVIDINDITFEQGIVERLLGVGSIRIKSTDRTDPDFWLRGIENVADVSAQIDKARRAEKLRRGLYIETS